MWEHIWVCVYMWKCVRMYVGCACMWNACNMAVCCVNVCACGRCVHMSEGVSEGVCKIGCVYKGVNFPDLSQTEGNSRLLSQVYHCHAL